MSTNETFDFSAPEGACLATNWLVRGAATDAPCLTGVLKIRDPLAYSQSVYLRVPTGSPNCCPCPEHATNKIFGVESADFGGAWSKQELFKGCTLWYGVNAVTFSGTEIEGGWGINAAGRRK